MTSHQRYYWTLILLSLFGCVQKYNPKPGQAYTNALVVDGSLNSGQGQAMLTLSRTGSLSAPARIPEDGATVTIQGSDSTNYSLTGTSNGNYMAEDLNLDPGRQYRLLITTLEGDNYVSDFVPVIPNPPIDSINYQFETNGSLDIWVYTHNALNNTKYYQWEFGETWEFHSEYPSSLKYDTIGMGPAAVITLDPSITSITGNPIDSSIYRCWHSDSSSSILIGNTAASGADVISQPIANFSIGAQAMTVLYSINVRQFGWSKAGYQFLQGMKTNTEEIGSVFGPLPTQLPGNIHCISNPSQLVIGFFNVTPLQQQRYFISHSQLPNWTYDPVCELIVVDNVPDSIRKYSLNYLPVAPVDTVPIPMTSFLYNILSFSAATNTCVDCTLTGSNVKPPFWP